MSYGDIAGPNWFPPCSSGTKGEPQVFASARPRFMRDYAIYISSLDTVRPGSRKLHVVVFAIPRAFSLSPPTHCTRGWFLSTHTSVGRPHERQLRSTHGSGRTSIQCPCRQTRRRCSRRHRPLQRRRHRFRSGSGRRRLRRRQYAANMRLELQARRSMCVLSGTDALVRDRDSRLLRRHHHHRIDAPTQSSCCSRSTH